MSSTILPTSTGKAFITIGFNLVTVFFGQIPNNKLKYLIPTILATLIALLGAI